MFRTIEDIENKISTNYRKNTTYIHPITSNEEIAKLIAAYSNSNGGDIVFGIRDNGERLEIKKFAFSIDLERIQNLIDGKIDIKSAYVNIKDKNLYYISINKVEKLVKVNNKIYKISDMGVAEQMKDQQIFISYCWNDTKFADLIDNDFQSMGYNLIRDVRNIEFKDSIKNFMQTIGKSDFVISIISDQYLKSVNCMYEITEVMRSREYKEKMLLVILKDSDKNFLPSLSEVQTTIAASIYSFEQRIGYISYWEKKGREYRELIEEITQDTNKIEALQELKRIQNISNNISEFLNDISDWSNTNLSDLKASNYASFVKEINQSTD